MKYFSTRDKSLKFSFKDIFLRGLAPGGGLFLPSEIKHYNNEGVFIHYKNPYGLCGYSKSPCNLIDVNIKKEKKFGYVMFKKTNR